MIRHAQDTFATFARAGALQGEKELSELGRACAEDHETMQREFNEYSATLFVAHMNGTVAASGAPSIRAGATHR